MACGSSSASLDLLLLSSHPLQLNLLLPPLLSGYISFPDGSVVKELACNAGDTGDAGLIPGFGRSSGEGNGYSLQCSGLENSMDCIVHGVAKSWTGLSNFHDHDVTMCVCASAHSVVFNSWKAYGLRPARLLSPWDSPGKNTGGVAISFSSA